MNLNHRLQVYPILIVLAQTTGIYVAGEDNPTIPKCCNLGQTLSPSSECVESALEFDPPFWPEHTNFNLIIHSQCASGWYLLDPEEDSRHQFSIFRNSSLFVPNLTGDEELSIDNYCLETVERNGTAVVLPFICFSGDAYDSIREDGKLEVDDEEETTFDVEFIPLIPKCCPPGQSLNDDSECIDSDLEFEPIFWNNYSPPAVDLLVGLRCKYDWFRLDPRIEPADEFHLLPNGSLYAPGNYETPLSREEYCLESVNTSSGPFVLPLVCFAPLPWDETAKNFVMSIYPIGCLVSVPFLFITLVVFVTFKQFRCLKGKILSSFVIALTISYILLAVEHLLTKDSSETCKILVFVSQLSSLSSYFWLNILSIYAWWTISLAENRKSSTKAMERKYFIYFSLYGWLTPFVILTLPHVMHFLSFISGSREELKYREEGRPCLVLEDSSTVVYYHGPIVVLLVFCLMLFAQTWRIIPRSRLREGPPNIHLITWARVMKKRKKLLLKTFIVWLLMTLRWVSEMINSWTDGPIAVWVLTDCINTIFGLIVLFLFLLLDGKMRRELKKKLDSLCCTQK